MALSPSDFGDGIRDAPKVGAPAGGHRDDFGADLLGKGEAIYDGASARGMNDVSELAAQRSSESGAASM